MERVCGLMAVRLDLYSFDDQSRPGFLKKPLQVDSTYYGGVERLPWFDLDEFFYEGQLPDPLVEFRRQLKRCSNDFTGIDVCVKTEEIVELMRFLESVGNRKNEVIAIRSPLLSKIKGEVQIDCDIEWKGYDIVSLGHWSLLANGLFVRPNLFGEFMAVLNEHGLLVDPTTYDAYVHTYKQLSDRDDVEPLPPEVCGIDRVEIGAVDMRSLGGY